MANTQVAIEVSWTPVVGSVEYWVLFHLARSATRAFPLKVETNVGGTVEITVFGVIVAGVIHPTVSSGIDVDYAVTAAANFLPLLVAYFSGNYMYNTKRYNNA